MKEIAVTVEALNLTENFIKTKYGFILPFHEEPGEILIDSIGRGTMQK